MLTRFAQAGDVFCIGTFVRRRHGLPGRLPQLQVVHPYNARTARCLIANCVLLPKAARWSPQPKDGAFGQIDCTDRPGSPASAEQNLRLIKAFSLIADNRRRTWLIDLVEHFARLDSATRADLS